MAKSSKPLTIWVTDASLREIPELVKLEEQGHQIKHLVVEGADMILGPNCHFMIPDLCKHLGVAVKEARKAKYPKDTTVRTKLL